MTEHHRKNTVVIFGVVGGVVVVWLLVGGNATRQQPQQQQKVPMVSNPGNAQIIQAMIAARTQALDTFDTSVLGEKSLQQQQNIAFNQDLAQKQIAFNTNATQVKTTGLQTSAEQAIANIQASEAENVASTETQPQLQYVQNQGNAWWQNILGGLFAGFGGIF